MLVLQNLLMSGKRDSFGWRHSRAEARLVSTGDRTASYCHFSGHPPGCQPTRWKSMARIPGSGRQELCGPRGPQRRVRETFGSRGDYQLLTSREGSLRGFVSTHIDPPRPPSRSIWGASGIHDRTLSRDGHTAIPFCMLATNDVTCCYLAHSWRQEWRCVYD